MTGRPVHRLPPAGTLLVWLALSALGWALVVLFVVVALLPLIRWALG